MPREQYAAQKDYKTLKLEPGASLDSIKNSYKTLIKDMAPRSFPL